jgi:hypothetical protein
MPRQFTRAEKTLSATFDDIPRRIFLDSSALQALQSYGGFIYENATGARALKRLPRLLLTSRSQQRPTRARTTISAPVTEP